jgi:hypothetical protein
MSYDVNTMDALIVSIQMVLAGRIIHPAKPYMYSLLLENKPTSIYSHLTRNKKMKIMGRVAWLILLVVVSVCAVFCVLCCLQNNPVFLSVTRSLILKNENYELCFLAGFFVDQITTGKNYDRKKGTVVWLSVGISLT